VGLGLVWTQVSSGAGKGLGFDSIRPVGLGLQTVLGRWVGCGVVEQIGGMRADVILKHAALEE
jgi:hypothetical protein